MPNCSSHGFLVSLSAVFCLLATASIVATAESAAQVAKQEKQTSQNGCDAVFKASRLADAIGPDGAVVDYQQYEGPDGTWLNKEFWTLKSAKDADIHLQTRIAIQNLVVISKGTELDKNTNIVGTRVEFRIDTPGDPRPIKTAKQIKP